MQLFLIILLTLIVAVLSDLNFTVTVASTNATFRPNCTDKDLNIILRAVNASVVELGKEYLSTVYFPTVSSSKSSSTSVTTSAVTQGGQQDYSIKDLHLVDYRSRRILLEDQDADNFLEGDADEHVRKLLFSQVKVASLAGLYGCTLCTKDNSDRRLRHRILAKSAWSSTNFAAYINNGITQSLKDEMDDNRPSKACIPKINSLNATFALI